MKCIPFTILFSFLQIADSNWWNVLKRIQWLAANSEFLKTLLLHGVYILYIYKYYININDIGININIDILIIFVFIFVPS